MATAKQKIDDYFNGIIEIEITPKEQSNHDRIVRAIKDCSNRMIYKEAKKIQRLLKI